MKKYRSKTFEKGTDFSDMMEFLCSVIETIDFQPEGTDWSGGEPGPIDPVCESKFKYVITITRHEEK